MLVRGFLHCWDIWSRVRSRAFTLLCRGDFARLGNGTSLQLPIRLKGTERIAIGNQVFLGSDSWLEVLGDGSGSDRPVISMGDGTSISGHCTITAAREVVIGRRVLIARYAYISDHSHRFTDHQVPVRDQGITGVAPVRIEDGAWLGQNVVVCPGVTIGRNAVIGANSVVKDDIPPYSVAVGAPARVVENRRLVAAAV